MLQVTSRWERETQRRRGEEGGGGVGGTRSRTQEVEKDEELGDNVMHRGAEPVGAEEWEGKASRGERGGLGGMLE